ncbi:MAG TPA: His/Gly/Thr/Pro-type tRNA ligase C-terminal domain-containing protein, partial [Smithellaceae bacterium]|nr:His/Gly/Thr/Pro-type tRNA ligase C-terminal domain-containing protein [Smithellaceae bacterium]
YLCIDCRDHFSQVQSLLGELNISFLINARMVRGLDYYTKTAFEVKSGALGAQNSVAGGGRYDGLVAFLGGPEIAGIGFAVGFERLLTCLPENEGNVFRTDLFIAALGESAKKFGFKLVNELRRSGIAADMDYGNKSLKSLMKRADKSNSSFALILGDKEIEEKQAQIRNMKTKDQKSLPLDKLQEEIIKIIKGR